MRRLIVVLSVVGLMVGAFAPAALAKGKPIDRFKNSFEVSSELDEFGTEVCGIDIYMSGTVNEHVKVYGDGSMVIHFDERWEFHSPDTGETIYRTANANLRTQGSETFDPETGYLTINFNDTFVGLPSKWSKKGEGTLSRDAGTVTFAGTVVIDTATDELVSLEEDVTIKGPHPELTDDISPIICGALGA